MAPEAADVDVGSRSIAIAHWHINAWGGAEYLVTRLAEALDVDRVYTMGSPSPAAPNPYGAIDFVDLTERLRLTSLRRMQRRLGRAAEYALWEDVDWRAVADPEILLTSGATTRAVITPDDTLHVNYCHSPPRWLYDLYHERKGRTVGVLGRPVLRYLRLRDSAVDSRVDRYFANSPIVARRLWKYYKRNAEVLYPPVDIDAYRFAEAGDFFLHLGRLDAEKGVEAIVDAVAECGERLVLAGGMGDIDRATRRRIRELDTVDHRGFVSESEKRELLATCRAVVFNGYHEDFGIVPVEANASGKPCLVPETGFPGRFVDDAVNGLHHDGTATGIVESIRRLAETRFDPSDVQARAAAFSRDRFERTLRSTIRRWAEDFQQRFSDG